MKNFISKLYLPTVQSLFWNIFLFIWWYVVYYQVYLHSLFPSIYYFFNCGLLFLAWICIFLYFHNIYQKLCAYVLELCFYLFWIIVWLHIQDLPNNSLEEPFYRIKLFINDYLFYLIWYFLSIFMLIILSSVQQNWQKFGKKIAMFIVGIIIILLSYLIIHQLLGFYEWIFDFATLLKNISNQHFIDFSGMIGLLQLYILILASTLLSSSFDKKRMIYVSIKLIMIVLLLPMLLRLAILFA